MPKIKLTRQQQLQLQQCLSGYLVTLHAPGQPLSPRFSQTSELLSKIRQRHAGSELQLSEHDLEVLAASGCETECPVLLDSQKVAN